MVQTPSIVAPNTALTTSIAIALCNFVFKAFEFLIKHHPLVVATRAIYQDINILSLTEVGGVEA